MKGGYDYTWFSYPSEWDEWERKAKIERQARGEPEPVVIYGHLCTDKDNCPDAQKELLERAMKGEDLTKGK